MDRSVSRMGNLFLTLERLSIQKHSAKLQQEDLLSLRYTTAKIQLYVGTQEKVHRDTILKSSAYLDLLLSTFEGCYDTTSQQNIVGILNELVGKTHTGRKASTLVSHGATHALFAVLVYEYKEENCCEELLISIHQVLAKLAPKDRKFGVKARLTSALGVTLSLLKQYQTTTKVLQSLLPVIKYYSNNAVNASYLGKNGAVSYLFKVLAACGRKHLTLLKCALDALALLVKSKSNSARAIGQGGVPVLLNMFYDWHKVDSKNRHVNLRKSILNVLKNLTNLKSGRDSLKDAEGIRILYTTCQESIESRELETLIFNASVIMRKCFPKNRLPLPSLRSAFTCSLPDSEFHTIDMGEGQDTVLPVERPVAMSRIHVNMPRVSHIATLNHTGDENGYESSLDHDDDLSSDDDADVHRADSDDELERDLRQQAARRRTWDDLMQYKKFFPELYAFDVHLNTGNDDRDPFNGINPFVPQPDTDGVRPSYSTGNMEAIYRQNGQLRLGTDRPRPLGRDYSTVSAAPRRRETDVYPDSAPAITSREPQIARGLSRIGSYQTPMDGYFSSGSPSPSAVNLKTGSSVFSLDFAPKPSNEKLSSSKLPKTRRKSPNKIGLSLSSKEDKRRGRTRTSICGRSDDDIFSDAQFSVSSSLLTPRGERPSFLLDSDDDVSNGTDEEFISKVHDTDKFIDIASQTRSVGRFNKLAYPEFNGSTPPPCREPLYEKVLGTQRQKIFEDIDRFIHTDETLDRVIYDLDAIVSSAGPSYTTHHSSHSNSDEIKIVQEESPNDHLRFNSQFESGNLRKVIQIRQYEYDLILNPDLNTNHHHQWFYFQLSDMEAGVKYRFNIVNCEKLNSQFNFGMKPVMFSVTEAVQGRPHWMRIGSEICYYKNHYVRSAQTTGGVRGKSYYTATFTVTFKHANDVCYMAYHYPYTYSMLQYHIYKWEEKSNNESMYFRNQVLTTTIGGNSVPILTVTSQPQSQDSDGIEQLKNRPYIFLTGRVHPGESNASWVMKGTIDYLLSDKPTAKTLRDQYIFKIVPMLNPDGVINGNHRCSLVGEDLNRRWISPCPNVHPTIYHTKGLLQFLYAMQKIPLVYCDYHGHSRRKNVFLYGCSPSLSWMQEDLDNPAVMVNRMEDTSYKTLPRVLQTVAPSFSLQNCSFMVEKAKEPSARVVVWRQIRVVKSYTMESTYCGCDQGPYKGQHISTRELEEMGRKFSEGLSKVKSRHPKPVKLTGSANALDVGNEIQPGDSTSTSQAGLDCEMGAAMLEPLTLHSDNSDTDNDNDEDDEDDEALADASDFT